jgi:hypothetical protein
MERMVFSCGAVALVGLGVCMVVWPVWIVMKSRDEGDNRHRARDKSSQHVWLGSDSPFSADTSSTLFLQACAGPTFSHLEREIPPKETRPKTGASRSDPNASRFREQRGQIIMRVATQDLTPRLQTKAALREAVTAKSVSHTCQVIVQSIDLLLLHWGG